LIWHGATQKKRKETWVEDTSISKNIEKGFLKADKKAFVRTVAKFELF